MTSYADLAAAERELAKAAAERVRKARQESAEAAFHDTAVEFARQADEEERAARVHLEAVREYERLADEDKTPQVEPVEAGGGPADGAGDGSRSGERGFALWRKRREAAGPAAAESRVRAETESAVAQRSAEDEAASFFDFSRDMLCTAGFDGYFKLINKAWEDTLGYTGDELLAQPYIDFVHPADVERTAAEAASLGTAGVDTVQFRNRYRAWDGSYRWLEWSARSDMAAGLIYAVARDVTDQQRAAEVEGRLSAIVRSSNDAIYGLSAQGVITSWNSGAQKLYGYAPAEIIGQPLSNLIPPEQKGEHRFLLERVLAGESLDDFETDQLRKDGSAFEASVSISQIRDAQGRTIGASACVRDISETEQAERERD